MKKLLGILLFISIALSANEMCIRDSATCFPIGTMEVVMNFKPQTLRDYYEKWYRPCLLYTSILHTVLSFSNNSLWHSLKQRNKRKNI